jgi:ferredoxin--NADP+ reductase
MQASSQAQSGDKRHAATLISSIRITPEASSEEVRQLVFRSGDLSFDGQTGNCVRILAPGQFGAAHHARLYSIADLERRSASTDFTLCVRRCSYIDDFNGEEYRGVASNYLCDMKPGAAIEFVGPIGYPFEVPADKNADILMIGMGTGIAPFRGLIRLIYEKVGGWKGRVRLYHGAKSGLEMLYLNEENRDLALYYDQPTFKAFQAVSPRPVFDAPVALDRALEANAAEVWQMVTGPQTVVFVAGAGALLEMVDKSLAAIAGSAAAWQKVREALVAGGRWNEVLY